MIGQVRYGPLDLTSQDPYFVSVDTDLGQPAPDLATVSRLLSDGDVVSGVRSGNRQITLRVTVAANSRAEFVAAEAALFREADRPTNTLTVLFGAGDGLPVALDTYRAEVAPTWDAGLDIAYQRSYSLTMSAEPFFRSPSPVTIAPSTESLVVDGFDSTTGLTTSAAASVDTTTFVTSTGSVRQALTVTAVTDFTSRLSASWARSVSLDLSGMRYVLLWLLTDLTYIGYDRAEGVSPMTLTLSSVGGSSTWRPPLGFSLRNAWSSVTWDLEATPEATVGSGVDLAAVTGWSVMFDNLVWSSAPLDGSYLIWADDLHAYPHGSMELTAGSAQLYFPNVEGAARTPISLEMVTDGSGGVLIANTPNPPVGYDPVLLPLTDTPPSTITVTRKSVTLRRPPPECSSYIVVVYGNPVGVTATATAHGVSSSCTLGATGSLDSSLVNTANKALAAIGTLMLPPGDVDPQNTADAVTITLTPGSQVNAAWLVWAGGENVIAFPPDDSPNLWFLDAITPGRLTGRLLSANAGRSDAVDASPSRRGTPEINFTPGANHLLAAAIPRSAAPTTAPTFTVALSYFSRWLAERTS